MIKDKFLKWIGIPALGIAIPLLSHLTTFKTINLSTLFFSFLFFISISFLVWHGSVYIIAQIRQKRFCKSVALKLYSIIAATAMYSFLVTFLMTGVWQQFIFSQIIFWPLLKTSLVCGGVAIFFSMVYEILFLSKERELDLKVVNHLDRELQQAEINVLNNELDPHFVYNSLMPLCYLVKNDIPKAEQFTFKLIQVYQYFLENRRKDFITLKEELQFISNYLYLFQIRYKGSISLHFQMKTELDEMLVLPFSLQTLVENAIKHNHFDEENPLLISVHNEKASLVVSNNILNVKEKRSSTGVGLQNLRARYRLICNRTISVLKHGDQFIVKLPMIKKSNPHVARSYYRR